MSKNDIIHRLIEMQPPPNAPAPGAQDRVLRQVLDRLASQPQVPAAGRPARIVLTRRRALGLSMAAGFALLVVGIAWWLFGGGTPSAMAFDQVVARVRAANSAVYDTIWQRPGAADATIKVMMVRPNRCRMEYPEGKTQITDGTGKLLTLRDDKKIARISQLPPSDETIDPLDDLMALQGASAQVVHRLQVGGRSLLVYEVAGPGRTLRVQVDAEKGLPVRIESCQGEGDQQSVLAIDNIRWNVQIDEGLLSLEVPPGYRLEEAQAPAESDLIGLLGWCARQGDGQFPRELDAASVAKMTRLANGGQTIEGPTTTFGVSDWTDEQKNTYHMCLRGLKFIDDLGAEGAWEYLGAGVTLGDAKAPIARWRTDKGVRTVYGDLHADESAP